MPGSYQASPVQGRLTTQIGLAEQREQKAAHSDVSPETPDDAFALGIGDGEFHHTLAAVVDANEGVLDPDGEANR